MAPSYRFLAILALASLSACHAGGPSPAVDLAPAAPEAAIQAFLAAVDSNALDRMAALWGTERGPSTVVIRNAQERERRLAIMQRLLLHDAFQFVTGSAGPTPLPGRRVLFVELRRGDRRATVPFTVVAQRNGGWLVADIGLEAVMPLANPRTGTSP
ncbi:MAG: hypothetical protein ABSB58_09760 [Gemmatimonadales bacterium]